MTKDEMYFRVNEASEFLNAINMLKEFLAQSEKNEYYLKWTVIAAHNALQGLMVIALKGTSSLQVIRWEKTYYDKSAYEVLTDPNIKLDNFLKLFGKIKSNKYMQNDTFIDESGEVTFSINELNNIRNQFVHYLPCSWSISVLLVYHILADVIKVIAFLIQKCTEVRRNYNEQELCKIDEVIEECNLLLNKR